MNISIPRTILQVPFMMSEKMFLLGCSCTKPLQWDSLLQLAMELHPRFGAASQFWEDTLLSIAEFHMQPWPLSIRQIRILNKDSATVVEPEPMEFLCFSVLRAKLIAADHHGQHLCSSPSVTTLDSREEGSNIQPFLCWLKLLSH